MNLEIIVKDLILKNGSTTSLEVKLELRRLFPNKKFFQADVSNDLLDLCEEEFIEATSNGIYNTYTLKIKVQKVTMTELCDELEYNKTTKAQIGYIDKENNYKTKSCTIGDMNNLGYRLFIEDDGAIKQICPRKIKYFEVAGLKFKLK